MSLSDNGAPRNVEGELADALGTLDALLAHRAYASTRRQELLERGDKTRSGARDVAFQANRLNERLAHTTAAAEHRMVRLRGAPVLRRVEATLDGWRWREGLGSVRVALEKVASDLETALPDHGKRILRELEDLLQRAEEVRGEVDPELIDRYLRQPSLPKTMDFVSRGGGLLPPRRIVLGNVACPPKPNSYGVAGRLMRKARMAGHRNAALVETLGLPWLAGEWVWELIIVLVALVLIIVSVLEATDVISDEAFTIVAAAAILLGGFFAVAIGGEEQGAGDDAQFLPGEA